MPGVRASTGTAVAGRAAGVMAIAALSGVWFLQAVPIPLKVLAAVFTLISIATPSNGLRLFAGLAPLSTAIAGLCGGGQGSQLLEQMTLGIAAGTLLQRPPEGGTRIGRPALLMAIVAVASAASLVPAAIAPEARSLRDAAPLLGVVLDRPAALGSALWSPILAASWIVEGGLLAWAAERAVRRSPELAKRLVAITLVGGAAAAALNLQRLAGAALRTGDALHALPRLLMTVRVSMQSDWNAGASALLLAGLAGLGLLAGTARHRVGPALLVALVAAGVWVTGSRTAIVMGLAAIAGVVVARTGAVRRPRALAGGLALCLVAAGAWLVVTDPFGRNDSIARSVQIRLAMSRAGLELFEQAPVFGIGIGRFYDDSAAVAAPVLATFGGGPRENAHNNFVQVLAEEGLVGLTALLWWLGVIFAEGARAQIADPDALRGALILAMAAAVGTWLTGHPLLVPEFALLFWFYGGLLCALTPAPSPAPPRGRLLAAAALLLVVTVPVRAHAIRAAEDLEHIGFGLSLWQHDDVQRYREARGDFALYLPATGQPVIVPMRRAPGAPDPTIVDVTIAGQPADRITIAGDDWHAVPIAVAARGRKFERADFVVERGGAGDAPSRVLLRIGRDAAREVSR